MVSFEAKGLRILHLSLDHFTGCTSTILLDRAVQLAHTDSEQRNFRIPAARPIRVGYPDEQQDYASSCQDRVFYALIPLDKNEQQQARHQLRHLTSLTYYGFYSRSVNTIKFFMNPKPGVMSTRMARFAVAKHLAEGEPLLPRNLQDALHGQHITDLWLEGSVRITKDGVPLTVDSSMSPLAIKTQTGFYVAVQIKMPDTGVGCMVVAPFQKQVLDYSVCYADPACANHVLSAVLGALQVAFEKAPIAAAPIVNEAFAPGELGLQRQYEPSKVLGPPYYEYSTYSVETWTASEAEPLYDLYDRSLFKGTGAAAQGGSNSKALFLYLKVTYFLTQTPNKNGAYTEPADVQVKEYDAAVQAATLSALADACKKLKGTEHASLCIIRSKAP